jgi:hypothetical protein
MPEAAIAAWKALLDPTPKSYAVFAHGTVVIFAEPVGDANDVTTVAVELLREFGPVHAGTAAGDFSTITLKDHEGWAVTSHHPDVLTWVGPHEATPEPEDEGLLGVGLLGRSKRDQDGTELEVVHVRAAPTA